MACHPSWKACASGDCSQSVALVSSSNFGDAFIHSILRDNVEEYLAVITSTGIQVFDLDGVAQTVNAPGGYSYLSSVTDARSNVRAVTIADYTFISNTKTSPAMNTATAPATARPATHEALIWVKAANYGQTYTVNVNGSNVSVQTAVAPVVTSGSTVTENRISTQLRSLKHNQWAKSNWRFIRTSGSVIHVTSSNPNHDCGI